MKRIWIALAVLVSLGLAYPAGAQSENQSQQQQPQQNQTQPQLNQGTQGNQRSQGNQPQMVTARTARMHGTVQDVNPQRRTLTVKGKNGNDVTLKFGSQGPDLSQLKKGDHITATFFASAIVSLNKPGEEPTGTEQRQYVLRSDQGPGGAVVNTIQTSATVEKINPEKRRVTLKGPEGHTVKMQIDESVQNLDRIKKGDQIFIRYTEALGISVNKESQGKSQS